jgi:hypothetical protein
MYLSLKLFVYGAIFIQIICSVNLPVEFHISDSGQLLLIQAETLSETLNTKSPVTRLIARKIFISYCPERW